jgi:hypothetical protein
MRALNRREAFELIGAGVIAAAAPAGSAGAAQA